MKARTAAVLAVVAAPVLSGCGATARDQVKSKVQEFAVAIAHKDAKTICDDVFAPALVEHFKSAGLTCVRGMGVFFSGLHHPTLSLGPIKVNGSRASVVTLSGASGQTAAVASVNLIDTSDGWRIISLGTSPAAAKKTGTTTSPTPTTTSSQPTTTSSKPTTTSSKPTTTSSKRSRKH
jgi:hypothetical protein